MEQSSAGSTMFQTCQSLDYNESVGFKPNYVQEIPNANNVGNTTNFMTIRTEYTHDFQNVNEKTNFNAIGEKTANYYEDDFEEYNSEDEEQDHDKTRLTNKASMKEIEEVVDIYKNQLNENQTAKKEGFYNNKLEGKYERFLTIVLFLKINFRN